MAGSDNDAFGYLVAGTIAGPFLFGYGFHTRKRYKLIENIPTSKTRSLAIGLVEVAGTAEYPAEPPLTSPFACVPCLYYRYVVQEERGSGKHRRWTTIAQGASTRPFFIRDETGVVPVEPEGAELHLQVDNQYHASFLGADTETIRAGLTRAGSAVTPGLGATLRCDETFIREGDPVFVLGTATIRGAGVVIAKGERGACFCVSDGSEKDLLGALKTKALLCLYGGPLLTVFCLYLLLTYYRSS